MHMTQGWTGLRTAVIALGIIAWSTTGAKADALLQYSTIVPVDSGSGNAGVIGTNVISVVPVSNVSVDATTNLTLGSFQVAALPAGMSTTYTDTPFQLTFLPTEFGGIQLTPPSPAIEVKGFLNGTISGPNQSSVVATFTSVTGGAFDLAGASSTLTNLDNQKLLLVPSSSANGTTTIQDSISTGDANPESPVPEPSTIALFLTTVGGLGLRRFVLNRRTRSQA